MNILLCGDGRRARYGGVTSYVQALFRYLDRSSCVPYDWNLWSERTFESVGPWGPLSNAYRHFQVVRALVKFPQLISEGRIGLLHLNSALRPRTVFRDLIFARRCIAAGIPFVVFFHGWDAEYEAHLESHPKRLKRCVDTFGTAGKLIVLASTFKDKLIEWGIREEKIAIETTVIDDHLLDGYDIEEKLTRSEGKLVKILFLSRVEKAKGIYEAIDAYRIVRSRCPNVTMMIAGDGTELAKAVEYVKKEGVAGIEWLGWVDGEKKRAAFADADIYLFPSWGEGMPLSVLEAMAYGLPVVTRPVGGLVDFFQHGKMGFITESKRPEVLAAFCETLIRDGDLRKQIGVFNHEYATKRFLASQVAGRMQAIYAEVLEAHGRKRSI